MKCRGPNCNTEIIFGADANNKRHVLDASAPVYRVISRGPDGMAYVERAEDCYVSHFSTCRDAAHFSKSKKKEGG